MLDRIKELEGKTIKEVKVGRDNRIMFFFEDGTVSVIYKIGDSMEFNLAGGK